MHMKNIEFHVIVVFLSPLLNDATHNERLSVFLTGLFGSSSNNCDFLSHLKTEDTLLTTVK